MKILYDIEMTIVNKQLSGWNTHTHTHYCTDYQLMYVDGCG